MFYTIYKITNKLDNKTYIGKHQTNNLDDNYMGSGNLIIRAVKKYGLDNFQKEILHIFDSEQEMNNKEVELVSEEFVKRDDTYNICPGGKGGWGYINSNLDKIERNPYPGYLRGYGNYWKGKTHSEETKEKLRIIGKLNVGEKNSFYGKKHTEETKQKIGKANSKHQTGTKNSQYGKMWITDNINSKMINRKDNIPFGWHKGRVMQSK